MKKCILSAAFLAVAPLAAHADEMDRPISEKVLKVSDMVARIAKKK